MSNKQKMTLTSVKVQSDLFENFKIECVKRKFSFQKLADRSIYLEEYVRGLIGQEEQHALELKAMLKDFG